MTEAARAAYLASLERLARAHGLTKPDILKAAAEIAKRKPVSDRMALKGEACSCRWIASLPLALPPLVPSVLSRLA